MLDGLPYDIIFGVVSFLDFEAFMNLSESCRHFSYLLRTEDLCRKVVEVRLSHSPLEAVEEGADQISKTHLTYSREARLARERRITYYVAARRVFLRREAYATASPVSVAILGHAAAYIYRSGVLCYRVKTTLRVLDVHNSARVEQVINLPSLITHGLGRGVGWETGVFTLLSFNEGVLVGLFTYGESANQSYLVAVRLRPDSLDAAEHLIFHPVQNTTQIFARNNASYVYYGTHSVLGSHGHHEWVIQGISLRTREAFPSKVHLRNFVGSDLEITVCFEIFGDHFYALSNQTSFDVEEIDWTSHYHCYRFPLHDPRQDSLEIQDDIWRRSHIEGPINDSWTDLRLDVDETSGQVRIVESRREWKNGGSASQRTHYVQPISFGEIGSESTKAVVGTASGVATPWPNLPADDPLTALLDPDDKPTFSPARPRLPKHVHPGSDSPRTFILAKTKLRYYNPSCGAYLDLVDDPENPPRDGGFRLQQRLRLRIGSRQLAPPATDPLTKMLVRPAEDKDTGALRYGSEEVYRDRNDGKITLWPPEQPPAPAPVNAHYALLNSILNPVSRPEGSEVEGTADERSVLYATGPLDSADRTLILVNFDQGIRLPRPSPASSPANRSTAKRKEPPEVLAKRDVGVMLDSKCARMRYDEGDRAQDRLDQERDVMLGNRSVDSSTSAAATEPWAWHEPATYLRLNKGVWLV
ncbi:MAG: hypothetical protein M1817_004078 [Caeruleum heppii]|nr:MAG: hypothetical protein M1817_004078 [Caeruleum heppii]